MVEYVQNGDLCDFGREAAAFQGIFFGAVQQGNIRNVRNGRVDVMSNAEDGGARILELAEKEMPMARSLSESSEAAIICVWRSKWQLIW